MNEKRRIALVTGPIRGLEKNMAMSLALAGLDVILTYNQKKEEGDNVVQEIKNMDRKRIALQINVSDTKTFQNFKQTLSDQTKANWGEEKFDFSINNAGFGINKPITATSEEEFDQLLSAHFKGVFFLTKKLLPIINDGGGVVYLSAGLTQFCLPGYGAYAAMKGAIEIFTKYLPQEVEPRKIRVKGHCAKSGSFRWNVFVNFSQISQLISCNKDTKYFSKKFF